MKELFSRRLAAGIIAGSIALSACGNSEAPTQSFAQKLETPIPTTIFEPIPSPTPTGEPTLSPTPTESTKPKEILPSPNLRNLADQAHIKIATQIVSYKLNDSTYTEVAAEVANMAICAGELDIANVFQNLSWKTILKNWDYISLTLNQGKIPYEEKLNFADFDKLLKYSKDNKMNVVSQFLFYAPDLPSDIATSKLSKNQIFKIVEYYVKSRVLKYKSEISAWNVTNEVVAGKLYGDNTFKFWYNSPWSDELIANVFQWTHEIDPKAQLLISENNVLEKEYSGFTQGFIDYVSKLKREGLPVTTVGLQNHFWIYDPPDKNYMVKIMKQIKSLGVNIMSTETTVAMSQKYPFWAERPRVVNNIPNKLSAQAKIYKDALQASLDTNSTFGMFGFTDAVSLFDANNANMPDAQGLILDSQYKPKPAYKTLIATMKAYIKSEIH